MTTTVVIPEMTDPLSMHWSQPKVTDIFLTDDGCALMDQFTFDFLKDYSRSVPSGVYPGKMWKRIEMGITGLEQTPYLCWFGPEEIKGNDTVCTINYRMIRIMDWKTLMNIKD